MMTSKKRERKQRERGKANRTPSKIPRRETSESETPGPINYTTHAWPLRGRPFRFLSPRYTPRQRQEPLFIGSGRVPVTFPTFSALTASKLASSSRVSWFFSSSSSATLRLSSAALVKSCVATHSSISSLSWFNFTFIPAICCGQKIHPEILTLSLPSSKSTFSQPFKEKCISEEVRIGTIIIIQFEYSYEKPSSSYCVMRYFWRGCRGNVTLITLGSETVNGNAKIWTSTPSTDSRAVYTRENKPRIRQSAAYLSRELSHLYEHGLYKKLVRGLPKPRTCFLCRLNEQFAAYIQSAAYFSSYKRS